MEMETYLEAGAEALNRLRGNARSAVSLQRLQLGRIVSENKNTAYGAAHSFDNIHSLSDYRDHVSVSDYSDYSGYIKKMLAGEGSQLTKKDPVFYALSSGSTGASRYVPVTADDMEIHKRYAYDAIYGMIGEFYKDSCAESLFGRIFQTGEFIRTYTKRGIMSGIRSSSLYQWLDETACPGGFDCSNYTAPRELLFPGGFTDLTYVKVRFALEYEDVTAIHGVFAPRLAAVLDYIKRNWELLLDDMEHGTVHESIPLGGAWRDFVTGRIPPNPKRAASLRALDPDSLGTGLIPKIWRHVKYILAIAGPGFREDAQKLLEYAGGVPVCHFAYAASEGVMGVALRLNKPDYVLLPDAGFFEFFPEDGPEGEPLTMAEVQAGKSYEIVFTNHSGLYRYRMNDVVRIVDFYGEAPVVRFQYRKNQVMNLVDEKMNMEQFNMAWDAFESNTGWRARGVCLQRDDSVSPARYLVYAEFEKPTAVARDIEKKLDVCLGMANRDYKSCRSLGEIGAARLRLLKPETFAHYQECFCSGRDAGQLKPVRTLDTDEKKAFFAAHTV